jgi:hypothetical protein
MYKVIGIRKGKTEHSNEKITTWINECEKRLAEKPPLLPVDRFLFILHREYLDDDLRLKITGYFHDNGQKLRIYILNLNDPSDTSTIYLQKQN